MRGFLPVGYFLLFFLFSGCTKTGEDVVPQVAEYNQLKVMTYNILYSTSNEDTYSVLRATGADIIGMQEVSTSRLTALAQQLKYHGYHLPKTSGNLSDQDAGILSRFPITAFYKNGITVQVNPTLEVAIFTVHLSPYPYEPYDFRDGIITTPQQAISSAGILRLPEINPVLDEMENVKSKNIPVFLTGDFNEPSYLDWNDVTAQHQLHFSQIVEWPVSKAIADSGLIDVYRSEFPNAANFPGNTWTTIESDNEVYDRIDIIYQNNNDHVTLSDISMVGGIGNTAGIIVKNYPSDHYAVMATYQLK